MIDLHFIFLLIFCWVNPAQSENGNILNYDKSNWNLVEKEILHILDRTIKIEQDVLGNLRNIKGLLLPSKNSSTNLKSSSNDDRMMHPVSAFVRINKLMKAVNELETTIENQESEMVKISSELDSIDRRLHLPTVDDVISTGEALLRLQNFYDLSTKKVVEGQLVTGSNLFNSNQVMEFEDCFELGKIAYDIGQFKSSIQWLTEAMDILLRRKKFNQGIDPSLVSELLEYTAFAAYKDGQVALSAKLTRLWIANDPSSNKAITNLFYYEEELSREQEDDDQQTIYDENEATLADIYKSDMIFDPNNYDITQDEVVKHLCRSKFDFHANNNSCFKRTVRLSEYRIEQLYSKPAIIRIHDFITQQEADHLKKLASTRLSRSTVQSKNGLKISDFRIAKTAWLPSEFDPVVKRIDDRLRDLLNLDLSSAEELQVVKYGLGGFYGPHYDSARPSERSMIERMEETSISSLLSKNDRLATVLIYLNQVEAGGSTVFPRLNLTVEPTALSAVIWFNLKRNGFSDDKTLHTGCPILLGTKWIATKWPREKENSFIRPCGLKFNDN